MPEDKDGVTGETAQEQAEPVSSGETAPEGEASEAAGPDTGAEQTLPPEPAEGDGGQDTGGSDEPPAEEPPAEEPVSDFAAAFFKYYPEFSGRVEAETVDATSRRVYAIYSVLQNGETEVLRLAACMATAHYLARSSTVTAEGEIAGGTAGVAASSSVGGVSVSFQSKPVKDMFEDFFASTPYGQEFLAWLATVGGISYVN